MSRKLDDYLKVVNRNIAEYHYFKANIFGHTLKWEGGGKLHKVTDDPGGWTVWGIAYNRNKEVFHDLVDFKDTTYDEAAAIAFVRYYMAIRANEVPAAIRLFYFDTAYNMGPIRAIKILQKCAGVKPDGVFGPVTLSKVGGVTKDCLYRERANRYNWLVKQNYKMAKFLKGWMNRINDLIKK